MLRAYRAESCILRQTAAIKSAWLDLQGRADCSYFLSWGWISTWLEQIAIKLQPVAVRVWYGQELVGLAIFVPKKIRRRIIFGASALFLNEYPFDRKNMVIEYNGLLAARGHLSAVSAEIVSHLFDDHKCHNEFHFGAIAAGPDFDGLAKARGDDARFIINEASTAWQVDLNAFGPGIDAFSATLSKNRRAQLRRSMRLYEEDGPIRLFEARNTDEALSCLEGLKVLHTERHRLKGQGGAFANSNWEIFHRALIRDRFGAGEIQLIRVSNATVTIGYLYNFVWRKHVYVLQTGFRAGKNKRDLPGYIVHVLAIAHNREKGMAVYDLMHGDSVYKRILCNQSRELFWTVWQRRRLKFSIERLAVAVIRRGKGLLG